MKLACLIQVWPYDAVSILIGQIAVAVTCPLRKQGMH